MPYNKSRSAVIRRKRYLDDMMTAKRTITWPSSNSQKLAYHIREAIWASQFHPDLRPYAELRHQYKIHANKGWVEAEYVGEVEVVEVCAPEYMTIDDVWDLQSIVGVAIKLGPKASEIYFPNAKLSLKDKTALFNWCKESGWKIIDQEDDGITITRKKVDPMFVWTPPIGG